jgi:hypothetical protein
MGERRTTTGLLIATAVVSATCLWSGLHGAAWAQQAATAAANGTHPAGGSAVSGSLAHTQSARAPRLRLTRMEHVGPGAASVDVGSGEQVSDREQLALSSAANDLLDRLAHSGSRHRGLFRTMRAAARIADSPNRALCMLTGADRARLDLFKRRVSLTWLVSW